MEIVQNCKVQMNIKQKSTRKSTVSINLWIYAQGDRKPENLKEWKKTICQHITQSGLDDRFL